MQVSDDFLQYISLHMASFKCPTHDMAHCLRVANLARRIASKCDCCGSALVAYVGGLVHDVLDSKLITADNDVAAIEAELRRRLAAETTASAGSSGDHSGAQVEPLLTAEQIDTVVNIAKTVGYSKRLKCDYHANPGLFSPEWRAVQDADLLDAIGCIGVARCYTFGGKRVRPLFGVSDAACSDVITFEYYAGNRQQPVQLPPSASAAPPVTPAAAVDPSQKSSTEHFFEKLLRIKKLLLTPLGIQIGEQRHSNMIAFLLALRQELEEGSELDCDQEEEEDNSGGCAKKHKVDTRAADNMYKIEMFR